MLSLVSPDSPSWGGRHAAKSSLASAAARPRMRVTPRWQSCAGETRGGEGTGGRAPSSSAWLGPPTQHARSAPRPSRATPNGRDTAGVERAVTGTRAQPHLSDVRDATRRNAVQIGKGGWAGLAPVGIAKLILPGVGGRWAFGEEVGVSAARLAPRWVRVWVLACVPRKAVRSEAPFLPPVSGHPGDEPWPRRGVERPRT